jgi:hypothetical protein
MLVEGLPVETVTRDELPRFPFRQTLHQYKPTTYTVERYDVTIKV